MTDYWTYKPKLIPSFVFEPLLKLMNEYCEEGSGKERSGKERYSCVFNLKNTFQGYYKFPSYNETPSIITEICKFVEQFTKEKYDYVLVHIYKTGTASIGWHRDMEAINSSVASVSLGTTRKFRLKKLERKTGWDYEYQLQDGDLIWMHGPQPTKNLLSCQTEYLHCVPVESKIKTPRINLTFRQK